MEVAPVGERAADGRGLTALRASTDAAALPRRREAAALWLQRAVGAALSPLWFTLVVAAMRLGMGWRIADLRDLRRRYATLRRDRGPLLVCANHLTLVDSAVIAWALGSPGWLLAHYSSLPWNVPERSNFASSTLSRALVYVMKCLPVSRGGDRRDIGRLLSRLSWLVRRGEVVLLFPEGGRSLSGRIDEDRAAYGVGRVVASVPGCRVLCVYVRGDHQRGPSDLPVRGEVFRVRSRILEPASPHRGMRQARDVAGQIVRALQELEDAHFSGLGCGKAA